jgi:ATP-dependent Lon protease
MVLTICNNNALCPDLCVLTPLSLSTNINYTPSEVVVIPLYRRPLFPGTFTPIMIQDADFIDALVDVKTSTAPYVGIFLVKEEHGDAPITDLAQIHNVGVLASVASIAAQSEPANAPQANAAAATSAAGQGRSGNTPPPPPPPPLPEEARIRRRSGATGPVRHKDDPNAAATNSSNSNKTTGDAARARAGSLAWVYVSGVSRVRVAARVPNKKWLTVKIDPLKDEPYDVKDPELRAYHQEIVQTIKDVMQATPTPLFKEMLTALLHQLDPSNPSQLADISACVTSARGAELQEVLEALNVKLRQQRALVLLKDELKVAQLQHKMNRDIEQKVSQQQQKYFLNEQLKAIKRELGVETDEKEALVTKFRTRLAKLKVPEAVMKTIEEEMQKFSTTELSSSDFAVTRNYLDWLTQLPWGVHSTDNLSLAHAATVLDEDHYGLKDLKERILEFIAVGSLRGLVRGKILCLVGPPGVGKCLARGTPVLMAHGDFKPVELIKDGESVMGDDGTPRSVTGVTRGRERMVRIAPTLAPSSSAFTCNTSHVLSLKFADFPAVSQSECAVRLLVANVDDIGVAHKLAAHSLSCKDRGEADALCAALGRGDAKALESVRARLALTSALERVVLCDETVDIAVKDFLDTRNVSVAVRAAAALFHADEMLLPARAPPRDDAWVVGYHIGSAQASAPTRLADDLKLGSVATRRQLLAGVVDACSGAELRIEGAALRADVEFVARSLGYRVVRAATGAHSELIGDLSRLPLKRGAALSSSSSSMLQPFSVQLVNERADGTWQVLVDDAHVALVDVEAQRREAKRNVRSAAAGGAHVSLDDIAPAEYADGDYFGFEVDGNGRFVVGESCFVTHNTSIGKSVARALDRKFFRFSVGGLSDVAEIKGHRRTYIGSMPGKLIQCLKQVTVENPVILIDEIDKMSRGIHGDPASALLEVLDPQQNSSFTDHYLDVPYDLSRVLFICTANVTETIPGPLLDRMEVLRISGYVTDEKLEIARKYLMPLALEASGLKRSQLSITVGALRQLTRQYCREAGVRSLQQHIERIARKAALRVVRAREAAAPAVAAAEPAAVAEPASPAPTASSSDDVLSKLDNARLDKVEPAAQPAAGAAAPIAVEKVVVNEANLKDFVGLPQFTTDRYYKRTPVGVVMGLAWTSMGGATMYVEVLKSHFAKGNSIQISGSIGEVMRESGQLAHTYAKHLLKTAKPDNKFFEKNSVHVHVPEGATPKDGPSAGVTMITALMSAALNKPVRSNLAMSGEVTLTGKVLPVGGIKEKTIAARRSGVKHLIFPLTNKKDWDELDTSITSGLDVHFVDTYPDVFKLAFGVDIKQVDAPAAKVEEAADDADNGEPAVDNTEADVPPLPAGVSA